MATCRSALSIPITHVRRPKQFPKSSAPTKSERYNTKSPTNSWYGRLTCAAYSQLSTTQRAKPLQPLFARRHSSTSQHSAMRVRAWAANKRKEVESTHSANALRCSHWRLQSAAPTSARHPRTLIHVSGGKRQLQQRLLHIFCPSSHNTRMHAVLLLWPADRRKQSLIRQTSTQQFAVGCGLDTALPAQPEALETMTPPSGVSKRLRSSYADFTIR